VEGCGNAEGMLRGIGFLEQTSEGLSMPMSVWTSTLKRTFQTAALFPSPKLRWKLLDEIQTGQYDGMTYEQIEEQHPEEFAARKRDKLCYRYRLCFASFPCAFSSCRAGIPLCGTGTACALPCSCVVFSGRAGIPLCSTGTACALLPF
jgi:Histidine phosphatase superfamily (branch 1)